MQVRRRSTTSSASTPPKPGCGALGVLCAALLASFPARGQIAFQDVTEDAGLKRFVAGAFNHAVAWGDVDHDGRLDLFLGNFTDRVPGAAASPDTNRHGLFRQGAPGKFVPLPMPSVERGGRCSGALLADLDNDGDLDLFVTNNTHSRPGRRPSQVEPSALFRNDAGRFVDVSKDSGAVPADLFYARDVIAFDYDRDGLLDLLVCEDRVFRPRAHTRLFRNLGGMKFEVANVKAGLPDDLDAFGAAAGDVNGDGFADLYLTSCNRQFLGGPGGKFTEAEALRPVFAFKGDDGEDYTCAATLADIDNDGDLDLLVGTHHAPSRIRVFLNEGTTDGTPRFRDVTRDLGIPVLPNKGATCDVGDFDNDGLPDLYWSCWFVEGDRGEGRRPFICRGLGFDGGPAGNDAPVSGAAAGKPRLPRFDIPIVQGIPINRRNIAAPGQKAMVYYVDGPAVDYDGDGRLDFFAGIWPDENSRLFRNVTGRAGHWLEVRVAGDGKSINRMGVGAKVRAYAPGGRELLAFREITLCGGYAGTRPALAHLGLGALDRVDLEVELPGRTPTIRLESVPVDRLLTVDVARPAAPRPGAAGPNGAAVPERAAPDPAARVRKRWLVSGRVQGVGFRMWVEDKGTALGLKGWVRNLTDGRVEVVAEGPARDVAALEAHVRKGPPGGRVERLAEAPADPREVLMAFETRPTTPQP